MYIFLIVIHIIVCLILILTILLQAGRGGGLTETGGSDSPQSVLGTQAPLLLKRATEVSAIVFLITSLLLAVISSGKNRSLLNKMRMPEMPSGSYTTAMAGSDMTTAAQPITAAAVDESAKTVEKSPLDNVPFVAEDVTDGK